jgi:hypothetical protein
MERQVAQVNRKNSTNCRPPEARLTVVGSVAWSSGPREVAIGGGVGVGSAAVSTGSVEGLRVGRTVGPGSTVVRMEEAGPFPGEQATREMVKRASPEKRRILFICLLMNVVYTSLFNTKFLPNY